MSLNIDRSAVAPGAGLYGVRGLPSSLRPWFRGHRVDALLVLCVAVLFAPFLLQGKVLLSNTDSLFTHYPNLLFGYRAFRSGDLGLWNPYVFGGFNLSSSMHHHFLNPIHWWLVLVPERYFFHGVTVEVFAEIAGIGLLALRIFRRLTRSRVVGAVLAMALELSGFTWFSTTTFIGTGLALETTFAFYVLITFLERSALANYVLLSLTIAGLLFWGHVGYIAAFGVPVLLAAIGVALHLRRTRHRLAPFLSCVAAAGVTGGVIGFARLAPVLYGLLFEQLGQISNAWLSNATGNTSYMTLTGLIPGLWGYDLTTTSFSLTSLGVGGRHGQFHNLLYFGVPVVALLVSSLSGRLGRWTRVGAIVFLAAGFTQVITTQMLTDVVQFLTWPAIHDVEYRVMSAVAVMFALGACWRFSKTRTLEVLSLRPFLVVCALVLAAALTGYAKLLYQLRPFPSGDGFTMTIQALRAAVVACLIGACWFASRFRQERATVGRLATWGLSACSIGFLILAGTAWSFDTWSQRYVLLGIVFGAGGTAWAALTLVIARESRLWRNYRWAVLLGYGVLLVLLIAPLPVGGRYGWGTRASGAAADTLKFLALACVSVEIIYGTFIERRRRLAFALLWGGLLLGDLLFFQKTYAFSGAEPFVTVDALFPGYTRPLSTATARPDRADAAVRLKDRTFDQVDRADGWSGGGTSRRYAVSPGVGQAKIVRIENNADDFATLFQDLKVGIGRQVAFGVWIRADRPGMAGLDFGGQIYHSGSGKWEYIRVARRSSVDTIRPTLIVGGKGQAEFMAPDLFEGFDVFPLETPPGNDVVPGPPAPATGRTTTLDLTRYRVNRPWLFTGHPAGDVQASIEAVYRVPTYGGVDSDVKRTLVDFFGAFVPIDDRWFTRAGIRAVVTQPRALDLIGVKYDFQEDGSLVERPNAIPRIAQFQNFEVIQSTPAALARIADPSFDPTRTLVLSGDPGWTPGPAAPLTTPAFTARGTERIDVQVDDSAPSVLLFNDVFANGWTATVDGRSANLLAANATFMAFPVPQGSHVVTLHFHPEAFWRPALVSASVTAVVLLIGFFVVARAGRRRYFTHAHR